MMINKNATWESAIPEQLKSEKNNKSQGSGAPRLFLGTMKQFEDFGGMCHHDGQGHPEQDARGCCREMYVCCSLWGDA